VAEDLETLLRRRQDELRGRPRDWRDDLGDRLEAVAGWWSYEGPLSVYLYLCGVVCIGLSTVTLVLLWRSL
jgi:hypothetical protein